MSHDMAKPTKWVYAQQRLRSAWASAQSDQSLHCALNGYLRTQSFFMRTEKTLIRLSGCPGWSGSSLGAHSFCWFCHGLAVQLIYDPLGHILNRRECHKYLENNEFVRTSERPYPKKKYNFVNSFNVKTAFKRYNKVLQGTICLESAKYSARICFAWLLIRWWIAEQTFLTPFMYLLSDNWCGIWFKERNGQWQASNTWNLGM